ncbi:hypothetical protein BFJ68_g15542 [Fusarium oxysporum]|uniref:SnoaL-like domain-containing protein n=1 Tax=Fusarium oxysporum TaxID=5507 RepID=A0A420PLP9_FUSOX|nr:hypothetical protein BFJ68_g15542 [Fusarium oxysporum]
MATQSLPFAPHVHLDAFHDAISNLTSEPTEAQLDAVVTCFAPTGRFYIGGINVPPVTGRAGAKEGFRRLVKYWRLAERVVTTKAVANDGKTAIAEMNNKLEILGESLQFPEVEVVDFDVDSGLIVGFRLYADGAPIQEILKKRGYR